jgi:LuxR family transcriptional regulator, regulator of acetate metabolism
VGTTTTAIAEALRDVLPDAVSTLRRRTGLAFADGNIAHGIRDRQYLTVDCLDGAFMTPLHLNEKPIGRGLSGRVLQDGRAHRVEDYATAESITHDYDHTAVQIQRITAAVCVPIVVAGNVAGVVNLGSRTSQPIGDRTFETVRDVMGGLQRQLERGRACADTSCATALERQINGLSSREIQVLELVAAGASNRDIARELILSPETVKSYLRNAMRKLDVQSRAAAVHVVARSGLI